MDQVFKFGQVLNGEDVPFQHNNQWTLERTSAGTERIWAAPRQAHIRLIRRLSKGLPGPFCLLFLQVVPRIHGEPGRYQSPFIGCAELEAFLGRFEQLFENDGRAELWIAAFGESQAPVAQIIYDRHEYLYLYGPPEEFAAILESEGLTRGAPSTLPHPHVHKYNKEYDADVADLLVYWDWKLTPLQPGDN